MTADFLYLVNFLNRNSSKFIKRSFLYLPAQFTKPSSIAQSPEKNPQKSDLPIKPDFLNENSFF